MPAVLRSDPAKTQQRITALRAYMDKSVYGSNGFVCASARSCRRAAMIKPDGQERTDREYVEGQLSHVGLHYDIFENDKPWRIAMVGKEIGRSFDESNQRSYEHISLEERRLQQNDAIALPFTKRHRHMLGTTSALRAAFGRPLGADRAGELLQLTNTPHIQHVMQCYALLNKRLCSAVKIPPPGGRRYEAAQVPAMDRRCLPHLIASIQILEPTLLILQSTTLRKHIAKYLRNVEPIAPNLEYAELTGKEMLIASFSHPAAHAPSNWGTSHRNQYAVTTVAPTIAAAREFWLS